MPATQGHAKLAGRWREHSFMCEEFIVWKEAVKDG